MAADSPTEPKQPAVVVTDDERERECSHSSHPFVQPVTDVGLEPITVAGACVLDRTRSCPPHLQIIIVPLPGEEIPLWSRWK